MMLLQVLCQSMHSIGISDHPTNVARHLHIVPHRSVFNLCLTGNAGPES